MDNYCLVWCCTSVHPVETRFSFSGCHVWFSVPCHSQAPTLLVLLIWPLQLKVTFWIFSSKCLFTFSQTGFHFDSMLFILSLLISYSFIVLFRHSHSYSSILTVCIYWWLSWRYCFSVWTINECTEDDNFVLLKVNTGENILFYKRWKVREARLSREPWSAQL